MSDKIIVIDLSPGIELTADNKLNRPAFVHRSAIADAANGLLLALNGSQESAGVIMLAKSLGCKIK